MPAVEHESAGFGVKREVGGFNEASRRKRKEVWKERRIYKGCERETFEKGESKVSQGVNRDVSPYWGRGAWGLPIEWHNVGVKASAKGVVGIGSAELQEGEKRPAQVSSCRVNQRRGAY